MRANSSIKHAFLVRLKKSLYMSQFFIFQIDKAMSDNDTSIPESPPNSPANQSDSDGSVSSGECGHHGLSAPVKCMWDTCGDWFPTLEELASHVAVNHAVAGKGGLFYCGWKGCSRGDRGFNASLRSRKNTIYAQIAILEFRHQYLEDPMLQIDDFMLVLEYLQQGFLVLTFQLGDRIGDLIEESLMFPRLFNLAIVPPPDVAEAEQRDRNVLFYIRIVTLGLPPHVGSDA
ncbi:unnamed protein product [Nesidiocoris tenuis]|uniref:C2H2-type domain-containing protein n=1 Tax=Nesidiocoris tenuis TaxID=355587 RepID=A0A6H5GKB0_9HEMI|nr:unnamed protein product [Nesidiocoris tenuis]